MRELVIRGLPTSLKQDAWWMDSDSIGLKSTTTSHPKGPSLVAVNAKNFAALIGLVLLADFLFWQYSLGVSLIIYSAALWGVAYMSLRPAMDHRERAVAAILWIACALPILEYVQLVSLLFLIVGHLGLLVWLATRSTVTGVVRNLLRLAYLMPDFVLKAWFSGGQALAARRHFTVRREALFGWVLPFGVGSIFLLLFLLANPVLENWADSLFDVELSVDSIRRLIFWVVVAGFVLPFVLFRHLAKGFSGIAFKVESQLDFDGRLINGQSIAKSLIVFNLMFLFQNVTDVAFLWGGGTLPDDMSYASYAHKGAYPLMATSVLAGVFAVMSHRYLHSSIFLRGLLLLWVAQNIFLVSSALMRLDLYVEVYGLTLLRMRASIGMGLVFVGMALLLWQLWLSKSNAWVSTVFVAVAVLTLYACCFVNFGYVIAKTNIAQAEHRLDSYYLCHKTRSGIVAVLGEANRSGRIYCQQGHRLGIDPIEDWRSWSFRQARLGKATRAYRKFLRAKTLSQVDDTASRSPYHEN